MPERNGFDVCREVKSSPDTRLIPVVLVTASTAVADRIEGIECGADDFLSKPVNREELLARVRSLLRLKQFTDELENAETVLFSLALSIEAKDPYTEGHCDRLSQYSVVLAERLDLPNDLRIALRRAGTVHDIGKVAVPEHVLLKPGPLTPEEWKVMKQHPVVGERICAPLKSFRHVLPVIRSHHEKLDGSGYPDGLKGDEIPLTARVLQVVDIYDALTTVPAIPQGAFGEGDLRVHAKGSRTRMVGCFSREQTGSFGERIRTSTSRAWRPTMSDNPTSEAITRAAGFPPVVTRRIAAHVPPCCSYLWRRSARLGPELPKTLRGLPRTWHS